MQRWARIGRYRRGAAGSLAVMLIAGLLGGGCAQEQPYGTEGKLSLPSRRSSTWAVAPALNLSGQRPVDALLQADIVYQQLQQVDGLTVIPVNRVVEVYASLRIERPQTEEQALLICDLLGCDGLVVPTVTAYDPYNPPKFGAALQLFMRSGSVRGSNVDPQELIRQASPAPGASLPATSNFVQVVGMYDAANGSVREKLMQYAVGRNDPMGPYADREYLASMDRYCAFAYYTLIEELLKAPRLVAR